jgi:hypothetical protein
MPAASDEAAMMTTRMIAIIVFDTALVFSWLASVFVF